jgi:hypothetical protein
MTDDGIIGWYCGLLAVLVTIDCYSIYIVSIDNILIIVTKHVVLWPVMCSIIRWNDILFGNVIDLIEAEIQ